MGHHPSWSVVFDKTCAHCITFRSTGQPNSFAVGLPVTSDVRTQPMMTSRDFGPALLIYAVMAYGYGLVLGAFALAWDWFVRDQVPSLEWWQYILAPLAIGLVALFLEAAGTSVGRIFGEGDSSQPKWKHAAALIVMFLLMAALMLGPTFYQLSSHE